MCGGGSVESQSRDSVHGEEGPGVGRSGQENSGKCSTGHFTGMLGKMHDLCPLFEIWL